MDKTKIISKERLALIQLADAVEMLNKGNYISAITLSAAAEEILGVISKQNTTANALEIESFLMRSTGVGKEYQKKRNLIRNELKHIGNVEGFSVQELEDAAYLHISAAIINYKLLKKKLPNAPVIKGYCEKRGIS